MLHPLGRIFRWFALTAAAVGIGWLLYGKMAVKNQPIRVTPLISAEILHREWRTRAAEAIAQFERNGDEKQTLDKLLALHVTSRDQSIHLRLVLALHAMEQNGKEAKARWISAREEFMKGE